MRMDKRELSRWLLMAVGAFETSEVVGVMKSFAGEDWKELVKIANRQLLSPFLHHRLRQHQIFEEVPSFVQSELRRQFQIVYAQNTQLFHTLGKVLGALANHNLPVLPLKGVYLAEHIYDNIGLRSMCDLDLMVHRSDIQALRVVLGSLGFDEGHEISDEFRAYLGKDVKFIQRESRIKLEAHFHIVNRDSALNLTADELWIRSEPTSIASISTDTLSYEDHFLHLCYHNCQHHFALMNHLIDIHLLITLNNGRLNWRRIFSTAKRWGALNSLILNLDLVNRLLGTDISETVEFIESNHFRKRAFESTSQGMLMERIGALNDYDTILKFIALKGWRQQLRYLFQREKMIRSSRLGRDEAPGLTILKRYGAALKRYSKLLWSLITQFKITVDLIRTRMWLSN